MESSKGKSSMGIQWPITIASVVLLLVVVLFLALKPDETVGMINTIFNASMSGAGPFLLLFDFILLGVAVWFAFSRYGNIKLGSGKPEYSMFSYIAMMACAALASASMFWSFTEWSYYVVTPGLNIEPFSFEAMDVSMGYAFFHWGFLQQSIYVAIGLIAAYSLYVRKNKSLKIGAIAESMMGNFKYKAIVGRIIDLIIVFCTLSGLGVSLGLGIPVIAGGINRITGIEVNFVMQVSIVLVLGIIFSWSSFVGTGKGMKFLSDNTVKVLFGLLAFILIFGPTTFIQKLFVSSVGHMIDLFPRMSLFSDPIGNTGFAEAWTIFFIAFPMTYAGLMGIFIAKISKGRSVRTVVLACMLGISIGTWVFFAINGGLAMHREISGEFSIINEVMNGDPYRGVFHILDTLPLGMISSIVYTVVVAGFICTTLDTASLCLASTTTTTLDEENNPSAKLRLFWCAMLTLLPLALMFSGASFDALKSLSILVSIPLAVVMLAMVLGLIKWIRHDTRVAGMVHYVKDDVVDYGVPYEDDNVQSPTI